VLGCCLYIIFNILWGINYNRKELPRRLDLPEMEYNTEQLREMNCILIDKINLSKQFWQVKKKFILPMANFLIE
jgi:hypothetical protein